MATGSRDVATPARIHPDTVIGTVVLTVRDLPGAQRFYEQVLGLEARNGDAGAVTLRAPGGTALVELHPDPGADRLDRHATGLYHLAILLPSRRDLAFALARLSAAGWALGGASDHLVSEALYLSDPEGNGIELYCDRSRQEWPREDGRLAMGTLPLDLDDLEAELLETGERQSQAPAGARIGHVHLQVADLERAEQFYAGVLGFDVVVRHYPGALFVSAGGYHHHIGMNTWQSAGAGPAPGAVGLRSFEIVVPDLDELDRLRSRIEAAGLPAEQHGPGLAVADPFGNLVVLRAS